MTATVNGWRVIARAECRVIDLPGGSMPVHPALAVIFVDLATRYHHLVEPLAWPGCWGWAEPRPIRGQTAGPPSNHCSGTAIDLCAPAHPQGVAVVKTFTPAQLSAVAGLLERYRGLITWGGTWDLPSTDGMHWELTTGATPAQVAALEAELLSVPVVPPDPTPPGPVVNYWTGPDLIGAGVALRGQQGNNGPRVAALQAGWRRRYPLYAAGLAVDGWWGPQTTAVCRQFAQRCGIRSADGTNIGPQIARQLYLAGIRP